MVPETEVAYGGGRSDALRLELGAGEEAEGVEAVGRGDVDGAEGGVEVERDRVLEVGGAPL